MDGQEFNRGSLMNVGYTIATREHDWDCIILHDLDLLPENDSTEYKCKAMVGQITCSFKLLLYPQHS